MSTRLPPSKDPHNEPSICTSLGLDRKCMSIKPELIAEKQTGMCESRIGCRIVCLLLVITLVAAASACSRQRPPARSEFAAWEQRAQDVTITRDDWGIPHIHGKTDADAVFGLIYAQAEDDFNRIEMNYLKALGRTAEADGESKIFEDLRIRLALDPDEMKSLYASCPDWLKQLATAWADGLNFFLHTHSDVHPKVITRFEPWMVLSFSEGSIGWDIESVSLSALEAFYSKPRRSTVGTSDNAARRDLGGSNGIAIAPSLTLSGASLLLINPHTSFFFRAESQVQSDEGLNTYGAITWGQFFVYQGFNERLGWMHTSTSADTIDEYAETIVEDPEGLQHVDSPEETTSASTESKLQFSNGNASIQIYFSQSERTDQRMRWLRLHSRLHRLFAATNKELNRDPTFHHHFCNPLRVIGGLFRPCDGCRSIETA